MCVFASELGCRSIAGDDGQGRQEQNHHNPPDRWYFSYFLDRFLFCISFAFVLIDDEWMIRHTPSRSKRCGGCQTCCGALGWWEGTSGAHHACWSGSKRSWQVHLHSLFCIFIPFFPLPSCLFFICIQNMRSGLGQGNFFFFFLLHICCSIWLCCDQRQVDSMMHVEKYSHVIHIVSNVSGNIFLLYVSFSLLYSRGCDWFFNDHRHTFAVQDNIRCGSKLLSCGDSQWYHLFLFFSPSTFFFSHFFSTNRSTEDPRNATHQQSWGWTKR